MRLPGVCIVCRRPVWWSGKSWREGRAKGRRHVCPEKRPTCGAWMPVAKERCARRPGHRTEGLTKNGFVRTGHRTRYALDNQSLRSVRRVAA